MTTIDTETATILRYALPQMEKERDALIQSIAKVRIQLGMDGRPAEDGLLAVNGLPKEVVEVPVVAEAPPAPLAPPAPPARKSPAFSAAARKRMAAAQKLRWINYHNSKQKRTAK